MTSATERLRALLDERGVDHLNLGGMTEFANGDGRICRTYTRPEPLTVDVAIIAATPEQAVAATLGPGTCREVKIDRYWRGCGECGYVWEFMYSIGKCERPRYCQNCGRNVVE